MTSKYRNAGLDPSSRTKPVLVDFWAMSPSGFSRSRKLNIPAVICVQEISTSTKWTRSIADQGSWA